MSYVRLLKNPVYCLGLGFGSGLSPKAPGTMGTLAAIPIVVLVAMTGDMMFAVLTAVACVLGIYICGATAKAMGEHDHPAIVWDEIAGYMVAMIAVPVSWQALLIAFLLFRVFDILKPWPISWLDKHVHGGLGIMIDDVIAGLATLLIMHALLAQGWLI